MRSKINVWFMKNGKWYVRMVVVAYMVTVEKKNVTLVGQSVVT